jgi:DNA polymerase III subunit epsilon
MNFTAIDFETANYSRSSACAIGLVRVEDFKIANKAYHLIRPSTDDFFFSYLHGITWDDVKNEKNFGDIWSNIKPYFKNIDFIAAYNFSFDRNVLDSCCNEYGIKIVKLPFLCTVQISRKIWEIYPTNLNAVCEHHKIKLDHHHALSDALACAKIIIKAKKHIKNDLKSHLYSR